MSCHLKKRHNKDTLNTNIQIKPLKIMKKNYLEPTMKLHKLKSGEIMAASDYNGQSPSENANEKYTKSTGLDWEE